MRVVVGNPPPLVADRNELRHPGSRAVLAAALDGLADPGAYPSWDAPALRAELAGHWAAEPEWFVAGGGSVDVLARAFTLVAGGRLVLPWPSFDALPPLAGARGLSVARTRLRADGAVDLAEVGRAVDATTSLIMVCTPNSPTGGSLTHRELVEFLAGLPAGVLVVIDQAYAEFADHPDPPRPVELVAAHPGVLVTRTFSKAYGLAGLRVGYGLALPALAARLAAAGCPFTVTSAAERAAITALGRPLDLARAVHAVNAERARLALGLRARGVPVVAGHGNFVWVPEPDPEPTSARLARAGVRVKVYPGHGIRVSVGTASDTDRLVRDWPSRPSAGAARCG